MAKVLKNQNENELQGGLNDTEIQGMKRKYGKIFLISVADELDGVEFFWFKKPDMTTLSASSKFAETDPLKAATIIFNDCLIRGRKQAIDEPETFLGIMPQLMRIFRAKTSTIKEF